MPMEAERTAGAWLPVTLSCTFQHLTFGSDADARSVDRLYRLSWERGRDQGLTEWKRPARDAGAWRVVWGETVEIDTAAPDGDPAPAPKQLKISLQAAASAQGSPTTVKAVTWRIRQDNGKRRTGSLPMPADGLPSARLSLSCAVVEREGSVGRGSAPSPPSGLERSMFSGWGLSPGLQPDGPGFDAAAAGGGLPPAGVAAATSAAEEELKIAILHTFGELHKLAAAVRKQRGDVAELKRRHSALRQDTDELTREVQQQRVNRARLEQRLSEEPAPSSSDAAPSRPRRTTTRHSDDSNDGAASDTCAVQ
eukprot:TRINITY_DN6168_c0_g1_i1.p1 TRINITY_DN6168_c0_g1~~TRINITY_DN6168_c0_g1_i1.p1  ORF type:complete len:309 (+),score=56.31 TRINITY_DN6168_c0_g1_i1:46-972(+)